MNFLIEASTKFLRIIATRFFDFLRLTTTLRNKFLKNLLPFFFWMEPSVSFHVSLILSVFTIILSVFARVKMVTFLSLHPVCMSIGTLIFIAEGIVLFRDRFLIESFSPIMEKSRRLKSRTIHQSLGVIGSAFLVMGLLFVWTSEVRVRHSIVPNSIHSFLGFAALSMIISQILVGHQKLWDIELKSKSQSVTNFAWHVDFGFFIWDIMCLTIVSGAILLLEYYSYISLICIITTLFFSWISLHLQMNKKKGSNPGLNQLNTFASVNGSNNIDDLNQINSNNGDNVRDALLTEERENFDF